MVRPPVLDEHEVCVAARPDEVWPALLAVVDAAFTRRGAAGYARAVGGVPRRAAGPRPLAVGTTLPGFEVTTADPGRELALEGRHRFSTYALTFRLAPDGDGTRLAAESRASFPGPHGWAYRQIVLRSGAHVAGVRGLLAATGRGAEAAP